MKRILFIFSVLSLSTIAWAQTPAFPGAEGHGRYVTGGRASDGTTKVYHVTSLANSGTGTLRWALSQAGPRTIVFDVGGVIELTSNLTIPANTTIAGQTAPYPGITIRYYTISTNDRNNIIVRFIRFRRGQEKNVDDGADAATGRNSTGIIFDHCSFSWSIDEVASFYDNNNFTMQWCTIAESLVNAGHNKGAHGYGGIWGGKLASFHHNLIAHVVNRSPRFCGARYQWTGYKNNKLYSEYNWENYVQAEIVDFRNCIIYNSGNGCYGGPGGGYVNIVNNYYKQGPSANTNRITTVTVGAPGNSDKVAAYGMTSRYYIDGNVMTAKASVTKDNWSGVTYDPYNSGSSDAGKRNDGTYVIDGIRCSLDTLNYYGDGVPHYAINSGTRFIGKLCVPIKCDTPTEKGEITTHTADQAYSKVMAYAGASLYRDAEDARYMEELKTGTATCTGSVTKKAGLIDVVKDIPNYREGYVLPDGNGNTRSTSFDADKDGMADEWEQKNGGDLDPNAFTLDKQDKYSNLEVYLSSIVEDIMKAGQADGDGAVNDYYPSSEKLAINPVLTSEIKTTEYFDLDGKKLAAPNKGISIRKETIANGQTITTKVLK